MKTTYKHDVPKQRKKYSRFLNTSLPRISFDFGTMFGLFTETGGFI